MEVIVQIEVKIQEDCKEPKIIIVTDKMTEEINAILNKFSEEHPKLLAGFREDAVDVLEPTDVYRIFAASGKVFAETDQGEYQLKMRLYELEQWLDAYLFVRISNSEIINMKRVRRFDMSFTGTICVTLTNGTVTYVSRRYVPKIRKSLGM